MRRDVSAHFDFYYYLRITYLWSRRIETRLRAKRPVLNSRQVQLWDFFSSLPGPDRLWGPSSLLSNRYRGQSGRGVKLTTHLHLVTTTCGVIPPLPNMSTLRVA
jgi:hypothetical protein